MKAKAVHHTSSDPEQWVEQHGDCLFGYALQRLRDRALAEDIVQETLLAALQARANFSGQSSERTWLIGILKHKIFDYYRRTSREVPLDDEEMMAHEPDDLFSATGEWPGHWKKETGPTAWAADPATVLEKKEFWEAINRCLSEMPARMAQVFVLREMDGLSTEEICQAMNISASNLWVMLHRARAHLRRGLEVSYFGQRMEPSRRGATAVVS